MTPVGGFSLDIADNLTFFEFEEPVGHPVIAVVMAHHEYGFISRLQLRQDLKIENFLEIRVLVGSPLVKYIHLTIFQVGREQG